MSAVARGVRILDGGGSEILHPFDVEVASGEIVGLAGETGSGKSTLALSILGYVAPGLVLASGEVDVQGHTTLSLAKPPAPAALRDVRGRIVSYVPQDPGLALDPGLTIAASFSQVVRAHRDLTAAEVVARRTELFESVGLASDEEFARRYPYQLSGGQQQRVAIAIAFALEPALVVMDEPTTGLDVSTKARVVDLVRMLARERSAGILLISHDLPLLLGLCDRVLVMRSGRLVEEGASTQIRQSPREAYTRRLVDAVPTIGTPPARPSTPAILSIEKLSATHAGKTVVSEVDVGVADGSCLAIIGESGSGKTTLARAIAGIHRDWSGDVVLDGVPLARDVRRRDRAQLSDLQYVFQSPWGSLNPRRTVGRSIAVAARRLLGVSGAEARERALEMLSRVGLPAAHYDTMPQRLSGGQRQRAALARALVARPRILICDEVTSSLDVSVQGEVIRLLEQLRAETSLTLLFITHDLALATRLADSVAVLRSGRVVEQGATQDVIGDPRHEYTRTLVGALERWAV